MKGRIHGLAGIFQMPLVGKQTVIWCGDRATRLRRVGGCGSIGESELIEPKRRILIGLFVFDLALEKAEGNQTDCY